MKKLLFVLGILLLLTACTNQSEAPAGDQPYREYLNTADGNEKSSLKLYIDQTFELIEVNGSSKLSIKGRYGKEGDHYLFSNFDEFMGADGNKVFNFTFTELAEGILQLNDTLYHSKTGDFFTYDGTIDPKYYDLNDKTEKSLTFSLSRENSDGLNPDYVPTIRFYTDDTFVFTENLYAGMGDISGTYEVSEKKISCKVEDNSALMGFAGEGIKEIVFEAQSDGSYRLQSDLCMSRQGDLFYDGSKQPDYSNIEPTVYEVGFYQRENTDNLNNEYLPSLRLFSDGTFIFTENFFSGLGELKGVYYVGADGYRLEVDPASHILGFTGGDVEEIDFDFNGSDLILKTDICMSQKGDNFFYFQ